eukprot:364833-Chlamydomonas_euryale.AAC.16
MARGTWASSQTPALSSFVVFHGSLSPFPLTVNFTMANVLTTQSIPPSPPPPPPPRPPSPPMPPPSPPGKSNALPLGLGIGLGIGIPVLCALIALAYYLYTKKKHAKTEPMKHTSDGSVPVNVVVPATGV